MAVSRHRFRALALGAALSGLLLASASCSLFTDLGGLTEGDRLTAGGDASTDARSSDGGGATDGGGAKDGGSDGSTGGPTRFCATVDAAVCDDFDDPTLSSAWAVDKSPASTVTVAPVAGAPSAPNALRSVAVLGGASSTKAFLGRSVNIPPGISEIHAASKIRAESLDVGDHLDVTALRFEGGGTEYFAIATIERKPDGFIEVGIEDCVFPADVCRTAVSPARMSATSWIDLGIHIKVTAMGTGEVWVTQTGARTAQLMFDAGAVPDTNVVGVAVGISYSTPAMAAILNDDFTLSFR